MGLREDFNMAYRPKYFTINELVPESLTEALHEDLLWGMFDENVLMFADWIKEFCNMAPVTINDWEWGGIYSQSGIRTKDSKYYSEGSMHSVGKALDLKVRGYTAEGLRKALRAYEEAGNKVPYITRIEEGTVGWLHVDTKETGLDKVYYFNP